MMETPLGKELFIIYMANTKHSNNIFHYYFVQFINRNKPAIKI